ncbi:sugar phosphate nucleotidyltransferase [Streptomyces sp. NPDC002623]
MKALILANGRATRLGPVSRAVLKALLPVANRPVLWYVLQSLREAGVDEIGITVGPDTRPVVDYVRALEEPLEDPRPHVEFLWEDRRSGTGGALRDHRAYLAGAPAVVVPADIIAGVDIAALVRHHRAHPAAVTVAVTPQDPARWDGDFLVADGPFASAYLFKPGAASPSRLGSTGAWVVDPRALSLVPAQGFCDFSEQVLPRLPTRDLPLGVFDAGAVYQRDVGVPQRFYDSNIEALTGRSSASRYLPPAGPCGAGDVARVAHGPVLIGPDVEVHSSARIHGPTVIGGGCVIGPHASVVSSVLLPGSVVPAHTLLSTSVFGTTDRLYAELLRRPSPDRRDRLVDTAGDTS